ncbi:unnamed protein product, partial [Cyprideis torosa]
MDTLRYFGRIHRIPDRSQFLRELLDLPEGDHRVKHISYQETENPTIGKFPWSVHLLTAFWFNNRSIVSVTCIPNGYSQAIATQA